MKFFCSGKSSAPVAESTEADAGNFTFEDKLNKTLLEHNWRIKKDSVQSSWNKFESNLVQIGNILAPLQPLKQIEIKNQNPQPTKKQDQQKK